MRCFFSRMAISHALDRDGPIPDRVRRHILHCPACRQFHETAAALPEKLRNDLPEKGTPEDLSLCERVVSAVQREGVRERPPRRSVLSRSLWVPVAAASLVLICLLFLLDSGRDNGEDGALDDLASGTESAVISDWDLLTRNDLLDGGSLCIDLVSRPLRAEVERLSRDAEAVSEFFIDFLPVEALLGKAPEKNGKQ